MFHHKESTTGVGFLGAGTVGGEVIRRFGFSEAAAPLQITKVLIRDLHKERPFYLPSQIITTDANEILHDRSTRIVVSLLGNELPEYEFIAEALQRGKFVVTAHKGVIAKYGPELLTLAEKNKVGLFFEAAVAGGIQIIDNLQTRYLPNKFKAFRGIINGTTNYMLTRMTEEGLGFEDCLKEAQKLGYAEPDPTNDIEGIDAAYKLAILTSLAFRKGWVYPSEIHRNGIKWLKKTDFECAAKLGYVIKLIAQSKVEDNQLEAWVAPALTLKDTFLAGIKGSLNGLFFLGDPIGEVELLGRGAGAGPTSASVWADVFKAAEHIRNRTYPRFSIPTSSVILRPFEDCVNPHYVRVTVTNMPGDVEKVSSSLGAMEINVNRIEETGNTRNDGTKELVILTGPSKEKDLSLAVNKLRHEKVIYDVITTISVIQ